MLTLMRQQNVTCGVTAPVMSIDDMLPKPLETKQDMEEFCEKLEACDHFQFFLLACLQGGRMTQSGCQGYPSTRVTLAPRLP